LKSASERTWYARQTIENGWSRNVLVHHIESGLFIRQGYALTNFDRTLLAGQCAMLMPAMLAPIGARRVRSLLIHRNVIQFRMTTVPNFGGRVMWFAQKCKGPLKFCVTIVSLRKVTAHDAYHRSRMQLLLPLAPWEFDYDNLIAEHIAQWGP